jgi:hypothetical protein
MRETDFELLRRTCQSLTTCEDLVAQVEGIEVRMRGLQSPYRLYRSIEFGTINPPLPRGILLILGERYGLAIRGGAYFVPPDFEPPKRAFGELVGQWIRLEIPDFFLRPVVDRVRPFLGQTMPELHPISGIWVLGPILAGYHFRRPVFQLAGENNQILKIDFPPEFRQGNLVLVRYIPAQLFFWSRGESFFNHIQVLPGYEAPENPVPAHLSAVDYRGQIVAAAWCQSPTQIVARDHGPLTIPFGGVWVALHPFPDSGAD